MHSALLIAAAALLRAAPSHDPNNHRALSGGLVRTFPSLLLESLVGSSAAMRHLRERVRAVAETDTRTLISGPSGSGKELVARLLHGLSRRRSAPFVPLNCATLPRDLVESELFGHERGAFTGAVQRHRGLLEQADGGTLFFDEIAELPPEAQAKLLRVLDTPQFRRIGSEKELRVDCRIVAASNRDLRQRVADGQFREDLFHRLNIVTIAVPALAARRDDIPELVVHLLRELGAGQVTVSPTALSQLQSYEWPGNVRELRNIIERALAFARNGRIDAFDLAAVEAPPPSSCPRPIGVAIRELNESFAAAMRCGTAPHDILDLTCRSLIETALQLADGNKTLAGRWLNRDRKSLDRLRRRVHKPAGSPGYSVASTTMVTCASTPAAK